MEGRKLEAKVNSHAGASTVAEAIIEASDFMFAWKC
jgi:hypothetical protein